MGNSEADKWLSTIELDTVFRMMRDNGATEILYKILPQNANSKNQIRLARDFSRLGKIPKGEIQRFESTSKKNGGAEGVFRAPVDFQWLDQEGKPHLAPDAQLIDYPQYPEVRLSSILVGCPAAPSTLWSIDKRGKEPGRILVMGLGHGETVFGLTLPPESPAAKEIIASGPHEAYSEDGTGVLYMLPMPGASGESAFHELMRRLCEIHQRKFVRSYRLDKDGNTVPCNSDNCVGHALEWLFGIKPNGYAEPDFRGWELKARKVPNIERPGASTITLFTPEPTGGVYAKEDLATFLKAYGYPDKKGRPDRINFGGTYRAGKAAHADTKVRMVLDGFNPDTGKYDTNGAIRILDPHDKEAMVWPFEGLMKHWSRKHAHAAYVPSMSRRNPELEYWYGVHILIGEGATFGRFLRAVHDGKIYYDPGIKIEGALTAKPQTKKRSQFRIRSRDLSLIYEKVGVVNACVVAGK